MPIKINHILYIALTFLYLPLGHAQTKDSPSRNNYIGLSLHNSYLTSHDPGMQHMSGFYKGVDVRWFFRTNGQKFWHSQYGFPRLGFGINAGQVRKDVVGNLASVYGFGTFPVCNIGSLQIDWDVCSGLGWVEKLHHPVTNPANVGISTHLNAYVDLNLNSTLKITDRLDGFLSFGLTHYSNAAHRKPNKGLNMLGFRSGVVYRLEPELAKTHQTPDVKLNRKIGFDIRYGRGGHRITGSETLFLVENYQFLVAKRFTNRHRFGAGIDFWYDESLISKRYLYNGEYNHILGPLAERRNMNNMSLYQGGFFLSSEFIMARFSIITQVGVMAFYTYDMLPVFERLGLRYQLFDGFFADLSLRAHANNALDLTWGVGYSLNRGRQ